MSDGNELAELLWENGQAVVHGLMDPPQPAFRPFGTGSSGVQEKHPGGGGDNDNMMAFTKAVSVFRSMGMAPSLHDYDSGLHASQEKRDDDTVPWIHYPIIEDDDNTAPALTTADYCSDFFSEVAAAAATADLGSLPPSLNHNATNSGRGTPVAPSSRAPSKEIHGLSAPTTRTSQPQPQAQPSGSGEGVRNFSFFSRPAALARATLQSVQSGHVFANQRAVWPQPKEVRFASAAAPAPAVTVGNLQQEMAREKATVVTSSVCSGPSGNDEPWHQRQQKRKDQSECSASQDESTDQVARRGAAYEPDDQRLSLDQDVDDESGSLLRSTSRSMKRSRTAEAHNLSERRRRDRINEKLRALQELIPNCNKIDKASMLDEAIEYLKTLQHQVQMMFMGTGLCIPLPPAMHHLQISPMPHFPHLGMGLGYGMGVFDMNITRSIPISPMPGAHFPCQMIPGASPQSIGIPGVNAMPMFGVLGQANPSLGSSVPPFTSLAGLPVWQNPAPQVSGATSRNSKSTTTKFEQGS